MAEAKLASRPEMPGTRAALVEGGLAAAAMLQVLLAARQAIRSLRQVPIDLAEMRLPEEGAAVDPAFSALRTFPVLARMTPSDARVLVVNGHPFVLEFEFWLVPRPVRLLHDFPEAWGEIGRRTMGALGVTAAARRDWLAHRGLLFTSESWRRAVAGVDYVLTFCAEGLDLSCPDHVLEPVAARERSRLLRVRAR
jgi:hypothetical protein